MSDLEAVVEEQALLEEPVAFRSGSKRLGQVVASYSSQVVPRAEAGGYRIVGAFGAASNLFDVHVHGRSSRVDHRAVDFASVYESLLYRVLTQFKDSEQTESAAQRAQQPAELASPDAMHRVVLDRGAVEAICELLSELWVSQTRADSSLESIFGHAAFRQIAKMGSAGIRFMLEHLEDNPARWSTGLAIATGENPVPVGASASEAVAAWTQWAEQEMDG
jgi:hypothetical protein